MLIAAIGLSLLFERHVKSWIDAELSGHLDQLIAGVDANPAGEIIIAKPPADPRFDAPLSGLYWQATVDATGKMIRSRSLWDFEIALPAMAAVDDRLHHHRVRGPGGQTLYMIERHVELPARLGRKAVRFAVGVDEADVVAAVWRFTGALTPFLLILGTLVAAAAWIQVTLGLRPLAKIRDRIASIRSGAEKRLGDDFPEEVKPLSHEIDTLLDAREKQMESVRARAADLAHGLKTPLQVILGGITRLKAKGEQEIARDLETAAAAMQRHVERQLAKARLTASGTGMAASAASVAEQVVSVVMRTPEGARIDWSIAIPQDLQVRIHPDDLAEALGGLVENAARHARSRVILTAAREGDLVAINVTDDGPGIAEEHFDDVLGRGRRLDTSGSGAGLGLAIVSDIAEAWGGSIGFSGSDGQFSATLRLPGVGPGQRRPAETP
jgi:signal transduction histidine kinase